MYELFYFPGNANLAPHFVLEEIGAPFELVLVDRDKDANQSPEYLKLNPNGRIPTLVRRGDSASGDVVLFETGAIIAYLADAHPEAKLAPNDAHSPERAEYLKWMFHIANTLQAQAHFFFYPDRHLYAGADAATKDAFFAKTEADWRAMFAIVDRHLEGKAYLLGDRFSAADLYLAMLVRWGRNMNPPARTMPNLRRHAEALFARPAVLRALAREGISAPYF